MLFRSSATLTYTADWRFSSCTYGKTKKGLIHMCFYITKHKFKANKVDSSVEFIFEGVKLRSCHFSVPVNTQKSSASIVSSVKYLSSVHCSYYCSL